MGKINILEAKVYNQIAAGEVVERPASVVKELVENSIDAGATRVFIEIENGGTKLIKVSDNGTGIEPDDLDKVFLKHATSKIKIQADLDNINSLGFRGEALASIASVSNIVLKTKTKDLQTGVAITLDNNYIETQTEVSMANGTIFEVHNLFSNVPARLKFLKKDTTEENEIINCICNFILSYPSVSFSLTVNGKQKLNFLGTGFEDACVLVLGRDYENHLIPVNFKGSELEVIGFLAKPTMAKNNKTGQYITVNGRYINNTTISSATLKALEPYLMHGKYPVFVLNIKADASRVDVNVHPRKTEIRFAHNNNVFSEIYAAISSSILNFFEDENKQILNSDTITKKLDLGAEINKAVSNFSSISTKKDSSKLELNSDSLFNLDDLITTNTGYKEIAKEDITSYPEPDFSLKVVGTVFNTYVVCEKLDKLIFIDQHAAHERLLYDKLTEELNGKALTTQNLLVPFVFSCSFSEKELVESNLKLLQRFGFEYEEFGELTYKISSVPLILVSLNLQSFVAEFIKNKEIKTLKNAELITDKLKQKACKAAIKGGDKINNTEIENLLAKLTDNTTQLLCPHGRPCVIIFKKTDVEHWFKRIV